MAKPFLFAEVAPAIPVKNGKSSPVYTYSVPAAGQKSIAVGSPVTIPLGPQTVAGTVMRLHSKKVPYRTKTLRLQSALPLTARQRAFASWMSETMHGGLGFTLRLFFPPSSATATASKSNKTNTPVPDAAPSLVIEKKETERYRYIQEFVSNGHQVVILVPELTLIPSLQKVWKKNLALPYHSDLSEKQRGEVWDRIYRGEKAVIIGTQKALFLPWQKLTHVVVEEEAFDTHKLWDQYPRLDNRYAAPALAHLHGSHLLFSGSHASLKTAYDEWQGRVKVRSNNPVVPAVSIATASFSERRQGYIFPEQVTQQLTTWIKADERILILHNQRGTWRSAVCMKCHQALRCPNCSSTVFVEGKKGQQKIHCRQCSFAGALPSTCPNCHHQRLRVFGPGTSRIKDIVGKLAPRAVITDITATKKISPKKLTGSNIVVGTTAVWRYVAEVKFDRVIWLYPETTLLYPDYRSAERAYSTLARLTQLLPTKRRVLVVTRYQDLVQQNLAAPLPSLYPRLLRERERLHLPPCVDLVKVTTLARSEEKASAAGRALREQLETAVSDRQKDASSSIHIRGPYQGFNKKEDGQFAVHLLLAGPLDQLVSLYKNLPIDRADLAPAQIL